MAILPLPSSNVVLQYLLGPRFNPTEKVYNIFHPKEGSNIMYSPKNDGRILRVEFYHNNIRHGPYIIYFPHGAQHMHSYYVNGGKSGLFEEYYSNGQLKGINYSYKDEKHG